VQDRWPDAFFVALRLPNHFRAIFAEGAFNAAFVPAYAHLHSGSEKIGKAVRRPHLYPAVQRAGRAARCRMAVMPQVIAILAPGFSSDPVRGELAISLTRITFPYLLLITMVTLYGGMLNVMHRFASAAAAPIFLNLSMMATLALAAFFPDAGHAAAWGGADRGVFRVFPAGRRRRPQRNPAAIRAAQARRRRPRFFSRAGPCDGRLDGDAGRAVCRYPSSRRFCPRARCRRCTMPTGSISCRSA